MGLNTDLPTMRDAVRRTADVVAFTDKHPDSRINGLVNQALGALSTLCRTTNPEFQPIASTTITMDGLSTMYGLPANFRSLLSVEYTDDTDTKHWMVPFEHYERALLTSPEVVASSFRARCYRLTGTNLEFLPIAPKDHTALVWFATTATQLTSDVQTFDTMERLDTYVIWWAAREIAMERADWERHDRLDAKLRALEDEIRILARSIELSHPARVVNQRFARWQFPRTRWGRW